MSKAQKAFIVKCVSKVESHTADNYKFLPPCATPRTISSSYHRARR